jgi:ABC-type maltose transport system permease subunit
MMEIIFGLFSFEQEVGALPIILVFKFAQKYITSGLAAGAVKE